MLHRCCLQALLRPGGGRHRWRMGEGRGLSGWTNTECPECLLWLARDRVRGWRTRRGAGRPRRGRGAGRPRRGRGARGAGGGGGGRGGGGGGGAKSVGGGGGAQDVRGGGGAQDVRGGGD